MINAGDFGKNPSKNLIDKFFINAQNSKIKLVRIACHHNEIVKLKPIVLS